MKVLITGTAGFIGFTLARRLLSEGHEVVGVDNFVPYYSVKLKMARHAILEATPGYTGVNIDLTDMPGLTTVFTEHQPLVVVNLAAQAGVRYSLTHPHAYESANLHGFLNVLECCRHAKTPRLVYASSSSVYGGNTKLPFSESDTVNHPVSLYAATKKANELMAHTYTHLYGIQTVGLRFFTVYGPWGRPDMAAWLFTDAMLKGRPIQVFNHGNMQRDFTYVDDIVSGVVASMFKPNLDPYEIFNLGNHHPEKLLDMIDLISRELGVKPKMEMLPLQPGDVPSTYADIQKASEKLGFVPSTPLSAGLPQFVRWFREYHQL